MTPEPRDDIVNRLRLGADDVHNGYFDDMRHAADLIETMVEWVTRTLGYPYDFSIDPPVPSYWRSLIEDEWAKDEPEHVEAVRQGVAEEGRWDRL